MNKTAIKIFTFFILLASGISILLLLINFFSFSMTAADTAKIYPESQTKTLSRISEAFTYTEDGYILADETAVPQGSWCILIDESGNVVWGQNVPDDIPASYNINDIAVISRWFLNDYPVYEKVCDYGLLILGYPKNSVGKYNIEFSMHWFDNLPQRILAVLIFNLCLAILLACVFGNGLYKKIKMLIQGIQNLKQEKPVHMSENGIFKEVAKNINTTSVSIERKNQIIKQRDTARSNWISGVSHDIRTPLSVILGYSEELFSETDGENKEKAKIITEQTLKIKKLIEDLNLVSSLEYDMQPNRKKEIKICTLIRNIVTDILNSGLSDKYSIELNLNCENAVIMGDEPLLERALFNLINNSIVHNKDGCKIFISAWQNDTDICINIKDNGAGADEKILTNLNKIPKTAHGLGLPMAYKIITAHSGTFNAKNKDGLEIEITLPFK